MDGPGHYREAEHLLKESKKLLCKNPELLILRALVHSNLAKAAAEIEDMESGELRPGWARIVDEHWA